MPVLVLDDHDGVGQGSRALCFARRTLEIADRLGCGQAMRDKGVVWNVGRVFHGEDQVFDRQHEVVERATDDFIVNLAMSVGIVILVLALFMGWRAAIVGGATLLLTVIGTLLFMALFSIEMERISLGALIIAMGMLVDNGIVVAEGMQMAMRNGVSSRDAAEDVGAKTQFPLLGATVIGIMAFAGIGLSPDATGEFLFSLFAVIAISLMLSWLLALTATPLLGHYLFKVGERTEEGDF